MGFLPLLYTYLITPSSLSIYTCVFHYNKYVVFLLNVILFISFCYVTLSRLARNLIGNLLKLCGFKELIFFPIVS